MLLLASTAGLAKVDKITIIHPLARDAQFELIDTQGIRVLIDVTKDDRLSSPPKETDILLTTHGHHTSNQKNIFPGEQLDKYGEIKRDGLFIKSIPSAHTPDETFTEKEGKHFLFIVEMNGLRIAHFGSIGQDMLTPHQLKELGKIDIALMLLANNGSIMDIDNLKAFNLMEQVKPKLVIPCHLDIETAKYASTIWEGYYTEESSIQIDINDLKGPKTKLIFVGEGAKAFGKITKSSTWGGQ